jgi:hypothetical protein
MPTYTDADRLDAEVRKLIAEERNLSRPFLRQPASWIALGTLALSLVVNWVQHSDAEAKDHEAKASEKLALIEAKEHKLERDRLAEEELQLQSRIASKQRALDEQSEQSLVLDAKLKAIQGELTQAVTTRESLSRTLTSLRTAVAQTVQSNEQTSQVLSKPLKDSGDRNVASAFDAKGYQLLSSGDLRGAEAAFAAAENAFNGYHFSYEIARLLRRNKDTLDEPTTKREVYQAVSSKYSAYASPEQQKTLKELSK